MKTAKHIFTIWALFSLLTVAAPAGAATITFVSTELDAAKSLWQIDYTINGLETSTANGFTVYFDYGDYENITLTSSEAGWDAYVSDPELIYGTQQPGVLDAMTEYGSGLLSAGFSITINWLGDGVPPSQEFELYLDYIDGEGSEVFNVASTGTTSPVPVPGSFLILFSGLTGICFLHKKNQ